MSHDDDKEDLCEKIYDDDRQTSTKQYLANQPIIKNGK